MEVHDKTAPLVTEAIIAQQRLGAKLTIRGHLANEWFTAMRHLSPDKPDQKLSHLYVGLWKHIFEAAWSKRNELSHSEESITARYEREQLISELREWKRAGGSRLGHSQVYLLGYDYAEVAGWALPTLRTTVTMLTQAATNFLKSQLENSSQTLITCYFSPINYGNMGDGDYG